MGMRQDTSNYLALRIRLDIQKVFIKVDSNDFRAYFEHAALRYQLGEYDQCIQEMNVILKRFPDHADDAYNNRGMCYVFQKKYDLAFSDFLKGRQLKPSDAMGYLNIAFLKTTMEDYKSAIAYLDTAILIRPDYAKAYANRAFAKDQEEKFAEAIADDNAALELQPNYPEVYFNRGYAEFNLNMFDKAIADYNKALQQSLLIENTYFYQQRALAYEKKGDQKNAKLDFDKAATLQPQQLH